MADIGAPARPWLVNRCKMVRHFLRHISLIGISDMQHIGFIGASGLMGHGIAKNLLAKGFGLSLTVHHNRERVADLCRGVPRSRGPRLTCLPPVPGKPPDQRRLASVMW